MACSSPLPAATTWQSREGARYHHLSGRHEPPLAVLLLNDLSTATLYRRQFLSGGIASASYSPRAIHHCDFRREEPYALDPGFLHSTGWLDVLFKELLNALPPGDEYPAPSSSSANIAPLGL